jgi:hypothetical protein
MKETASPLIHFLTRLSTSAYAMSIFLPSVDFFQQHAFLWDSLKFMAAGMFFDLTRRWSSSILDIVMECESGHLQMIFGEDSGLADTCRRYCHRGDILW